MVAFRFAHSSEEATAEDFEPLAKADQDRAAKAFESRPHAYCKMLGISLFASEKDARAKYRALSSQSSRWVENGFQGMAKIILKDEDGVVTNVNSCGHFTLHESKGCNLLSRVVMMLELHNA